MIGNGQEKFAKNHVSKRVVELSASFGNQDKTTKDFRDECKRLGFKVVFSQGQSQEELLDVLRSSETQKILASS